MNGAGSAMMTFQPTNQRMLSHAPVMLDEAIAALQVRPGGRYIDATFGGGGHTAAILEAGGEVLALDADPAAAVRADQLRNSLQEPARLHFARGNFADLADLAGEAGFTAVDGVLFDFGLSSFQLDDPERGFAFRLDGPLDMRMNPERGESAAEMLASIPEADLARLLRDFGEEPRARQIARGIVAARSKQPITSTAHLASVIEAAVGGRRGARTHPATRSFQAIRIAVNDEIGSIERGVRAAIDMLAPGGRLVTIAFHSLEDRPVKTIIAEESRTCVCPPELPVCQCGTDPRLKRVGSSKRSSEEEIAHNPRARSAVMRVAERLPGGKRPDRGDR
jgi:16S rRNA (cytosine1402-N4)-methyltransferase